MKQKLLKAQEQLLEAYNMARSDRAMRGLSNRVNDALNAIDDSILTLEDFELDGHHAN